MSSNEESIDSLERQLHDAQFMHGESERKYEDIYRSTTTYIHYFMFFWCGGRRLYQYNENDFFI